MEKWITTLGDRDLVKSIGRIRGSKLTGDRLRAELVKAVQTRGRQLQEAPQNR